MHYQTNKGIYIHIPFCHSRCYYCDFYTQANHNKHIQNQYTTRLKKEIIDTGFLYADQERTQLESIYIGGGTPSELGSSVLSELLETVCTAFHCRPEDFKEITCEVNPYSIENGRTELAALREAGFNRVSVGVQSLHAALLKRIGRPHTPEEALATLAHAHHAGFHEISADLLFGLPGQSLEMLDTTIEELLQAEGLTHVSAYSLSVEPKTVFGREAAAGRLVLPDEDTERAMQRLVTNKLKANGFNRYEISNFAKPGSEAVHNSLYWDMSGWFGFGAGASGFIDGRRTTVAANMHDYLCTDPVPLSENHVPNERELMGDFMFTGLRRCEGVRDSAYRALFDRSFFDDFDTQIKSLTKKGLLVCEGEKLFLSELGLDFANQVFIEFL